MPDRGVEARRSLIAARYPATPVDCLLSTLSELWDAPLEVATTKEQVIAHVRDAVYFCREDIAYDLKSRGEDWPRAR